MIWWVICENQLRIGFRNEFLRFTSENKVDLDELYILKITFKNSLESVWGMSHSISHRISSRISRKNFPQDFPARFSHKIFLQEFSARFSHKIFPSWILIGWLPITLFQMLNFHQSLPFLNCLFSPPPCPTRISCKIFPQDFPARFFRKIFSKLDPDWLAPHHPIPNAKFLPITAFLKLAFSPPPCPARISCKNFLQEFPAIFSRKIFPQEFPARFSRAGS